MDMGTDGTGHFLNCVNADPFRIKFAGTEKLRITSGGVFNFGHGAAINLHVSTTTGVNINGNGNSRH